MILACLLVAAASGSGPAQLESGPPRSPLSWQAIESGDVSAAGFTPPPEILGTADLPTSVRLVEMTDERPYGEVPRLLVWLARYESVVVKGDDTEATVAAISLAFDQRTHKLICAFTDPAPLWARSQDPTGDIASTMGWTIYPAQNEALRSTVAEVLSTFWYWHGVNPSQVGQIVLRPRFNNNEFSVMILHDPPSNVWIVESLGRYVTTYNDRVLTTKVITYRDGDLKQLFGAEAP